VVLALITAHIPLTAFAFMGGALALGLGFGAQNILNNFISGMILLVEKPIKLGDIVKWRASAGASRTSAAVAARCSASTASTC